MDLRAVPSIPLHPVTKLGPGSPRITVGERRDFCITEYECQMWHLIDLSVQIRKEVTVRWLLQKSRISNPNLRQDEPGPRHKREKD